VIKWTVKVIFLLIFLFLTQNGSAQFNHPELKWEVIETSHFLIHYHQGEKNFAQQTARIAEKLYQKLTSEIGYHPLFKIPVIIENFNDTTGGYTSIFTRKIVIQAQSDTFQTAGSLHWIREVLGHELTHYISFAAIDESIIPLRKAMANLIIPMWFIEGLAQYLAEQWHPLKEMVVGDQARGGKIMSEGELGAFYFFDGWGRMSGYYQSDSFVRYIFETYGKDKISEIFTDLRSQPLIRIVGVVDLSGEGFLYPIPRFPNFDQALRRVLGKNTLELYGEWREWIIKKYQDKEGETLPSEKRLISWGIRARHPVFSPRQDKLAFVSDRGYDHAIFDLYLMDLPTRKVKKLVEGVDSFFSFSPDGKYIVYSKTGFYSPYRSFLSDLYQIEVATHKIERLTWGERASQPVFSPRGDSVVFVKKEGGNSNLYLLHLETGKTISMTSDRDGLVQNFAPTFSPDGEKIVFVRFERGRRDLYLLKLKDKIFHPLTRDEADDRCPVFSPDGEKIFFISNRETGVFNLWALELKSGKLTRHTRVKGGVFEPSVSPDGEKVVFSGYEGGIFSLYLFSFEELLSETCERQKSTPLFEEKRKVIAELDKEPSLKIKVHPYRPELNLHYILPWFSVSEKESFFSLDFYASDVLEKHQLMGLAYLSQDIQYELLYINRAFNPTLWMDLYRLRGWSTFQDEIFLTELSGGGLGITHFLDNKLAFEVNYFSEKMNTYLFNSSLELIPWSGNLRRVGLGIYYFDLIPVREPEVLPWGTQVSLGVEWADEELESDLEYLAGYADFRNYWRISRKRSLALRLLGRKVENKKTEPRLAFSLGGWEDLRGYPRDFLVGENLLFGSVEYRFNWWRRMEGSSFFYFDSLGGSLFYDAGCTWREKERLDKEEIKKSAGFEFRLRMLPFGKYSLIMRMGMAWPLDYDKRGRFFLRFGGIF